MSERSNTMLPERPRVLMTRIGAVGDVCMATPLARWLSRHCHVTWLVREGYDAIARCFPPVDFEMITANPTSSGRWPESLVHELRGREFDVMLDLSHWPAISELARLLHTIPIRAITFDQVQDDLLEINKQGIDLYAPFNRVVPVRSDFHQLDKWLTLIRSTLGFELDRAPPLSNSIHDDRWPGLHWPLRSLEPPVARPMNVFVHPHASKPSKRWSVGRFAEALGNLSRKTNLRYIINSGTRRELAAAFQLWIRLRTRGIEASILRIDHQFTGLKAALEGVDLAIGLDSGPMHFASLCGVPTAVIFGPYSSAEFGPLWRSEAISPSATGSPATAVSVEQATAGVCSLMEALGHWEHRHAVA